MHFPHKIAVEYALNQAKTTIKSNNGSVSTHDPLKMVDPPVENHRYKATLCNISPAKSMRESSVNFIFIDKTDQKLSCSLLWAFSLLGADFPRILYILTFSTKFFVLISHSENLLSSRAILLWHCNRVNKKESSTVCLWNWSIILNQYATLNNKSQNIAF